MMGNHETKAESNTESGSEKGALLKDKNSTVNYGSELAKNKSFKQFVPIPHRDETQGEIQYRAKTLVRILALLSVGVDALYSFFLASKFQAGVETLVGGLGFELSANILNYVKSVSVVWLAGNLVTDLTGVDPIKESDDLTRIKTQVTKYANDFVENPSNAVPSGKKENVKAAIIAMLLNVAIKALALAINYPVGGSADADPVATWISDYFDEHHFKQETLKAVLGYSALIFVAGIETLYYVMFTNPKIDKHTEALKGVLTDFSGFCKHIKKHPAEFLETFIQVTANAANRGVSFAFIIADTLQSFFSVDPDSLPSKMSSIVVGGVSGSLTYLSRSKSTYDKLMHRDFKLIRPDEYKAASGINRTFIFRDILFGAMRASVAGLLIHEYLKPSIGYYVIEGGAGAVILAHSLYSNYKMHRNQAALNSIPKEKLAKRRDRSEKGAKTDIVLLDNPTGIANINNDENAEISVLIPLLKPKSEETPSEYKHRLFGKIANRYDSTPLKIGRTVAVHLEQQMRFIVFALFMESFNQRLLDNDLNKFTVLLLTVLWGLEIYKNDAAVYIDSLQESWTNRAAYWKLEKTAEAAQPEEERRNVVAAFIVRLLVTLFWRGPGDYSNQILEDTLNEFEKEDFDKSAKGMSFS